MNDQTIFQQQVPSTTDGAPPPPLQQDAPASASQGVLPPTTWLSKPIAIAGIVLGLAILLTAVLYATSTTKDPVSQIPDPTPLALATPTPMRKFTQIASTSAFISFQASVASLSADINGFILQDSTLTPPVIDGDLGLSQ